MLTGIIYRSSLRRNVPRIVSPAFKQQVLLTSTLVVDRPIASAQAQPANRFSGISIPPSYYFSTSATEIRGTVSDGSATHHETTQKSPGHVTRTLRVLDMDVVRKILAELKSVDVNADGR